MKAIITQKVKDSISTIGNKTKQKSALKIYGALYYREMRKNSNGFFQVPSLYLEAINKRYKDIIDHLIKDGIIEYYTRPIQDPSNIFDSIDKKYYNKTLGICMSYRFLIDITIGEEIIIDMDANKNKNWYSLTKSSLEQLGYTDIKISRDSFGRRVHHNLTQIYKKELSNKGFSVIDAKCSQPRLLYIMMKERGTIDNEYNSIFDNNDDFYGYILDKLNLDDRQQGKDLFMYWLNSEGYVPNYKIHSLFPTASKFIKELKSRNYKDSSATLQREEAKIWIDDILENLPATFGLTIHDSIIIKDKDARKVLNYCKEKYPQIEFDMKEL